jgi:hypothetical protein
MDDDEVCEYDRPPDSACAKPKPRLAPAITDPQAGGR